jgi:hypothetical protein
MTKTRQAIRTSVESEDRKKEESKETAKMRSNTKPHATLTQLRMGSHARLQKSRVTGASAYLALSPCPPHQVVTESEILRRTLSSHRSLPVNAMVQGSSGCTHELVAQMGVKAVSDLTVKHRKPISRVVAESGSARPHWIGFSEDLLRPPQLNSTHTTVARDGRWMLGRRSWVKVRACWWCKLSLNA